MEVVGMMTGEEFRVRRLALGMSQRQLAARMGYVIGSIQAFERGRRRITPTAQARLGEVEQETHEKRASLLSGLTRRIA